jgi:hypothetical protein
MDEELTRLLEEIINNCYVEGCCYYCQAPSREDHDYNCLMQQLIRKLEKM